MRFMVALSVAVVMIAANTEAALARGFRGGGGYVGVRGYVTSRGTYVAPHVRTRPDGIVENNLSYRGGLPLSPERAVSDPALVAAGSTPGPLLTSAGPRAIPGPTTWTDTGPDPKVAKEPWCASKRVVGTGAGFCIVN